MEIKISPSMLASDFANLEAELNKCKNAGAELIHLDVMDGHFVPNITIGAPVIKALKSVCDVPFDVHLMISEPLKYIEDFVDAGADIISFHIESESNPEETIDKIISCGCKAALAVKPGTNIDTVYPFMDKLSMVHVDIQVDGGINAETVKVCARAGANVFVAGSAVFKSENPAETISLLKRNARGI